VVILALLVALASSPSPGQARISLDVKDADIGDIVRVLAQVGSFQVVMDPGVSCKLTLALKEVPWATALELSLRACGLGRDEENGIVHVATVQRLGEESAERRRLQEARRMEEPTKITSYRLSYARAQELAPLLKKLLSPRGDVIYDARTNTLLIID
jgi:type IV pilus assembly protein PilQ